MQTDQVGGPLAQQHRPLRPTFAPGPVQRVPLARPAHMGGVVDLRVDHRLERTQQPREPLGRPLELTEDVSERLDSRDAIVGGLAPDAIVAGRGRREPNLRQRGQPRVPLQQLARLPPGAIDHHQRDRAFELRLRQIDGPRPGKKQMRRPPRRLGLGQRRPDLGMVLELHADVQLGAGEAEVGEPCRPDRRPPLPRVLKQQHARPRLQRDQMRAIADRSGPPATVTDRPGGAGNRCHRAAD